MIFLSREVCAYIRPNCPTTECPSRTFLGDNGKCYNCDEKTDVIIGCIGKEKISVICTNRIIIESCSLHSKFCPKNICSDGMFMGDDGKCHDCNED